jgi:hypothetical protein
MRRFLIGAGLMLSAVAGAQMTGMGNFVTNNDSSVQITEVNSARGGLVQLACRSGTLEVNFQPQFKLPASNTVPVAYRFDNSAVVNERWNLGPFGGALYLPSNLTRRFLTLGADASTLSMSFTDASRVSRQYRFAVSGFRQAIQSLPCSAQYGFTPSPQESRVTVTNTTSTATTGRVVDPNMAFIAPVDFVRAFGNGGSFAPQGDFLAWEYNGVRLLLQRNSTDVQSVFDSRQITLARPTTEINGRTLVPANLVAAFSCRIVGVTKPTDTTVKIGCGAGQTYEEKDLPRY